MNNRFLLDTSIVVLLFAGEPAVKTRLAQADIVFIPSIALGELYLGARKSGRSAENLARIEDFAVSNTILGCDTETAKAYSLIKNNLQAAGRPIPENDIWIAAIARQHNLTLATRDSHFEQIEGLKLERW